MRVIGQRPAQRLLALIRVLKQRNRKLTNRKKNIFSFFKKKGKCKRIIAKHLNLSDFGLRGKYNRIFKTKKLPKFKNA